MKCKRLLALALAAALCIVAAACGTKNNEPDTPAKTDKPAADPQRRKAVLMQKFIGARRRNAQRARDKLRV